MENSWPISFDDLFKGDFSWLCYCIDYIVKFPEGRTHKCTELPKSWCPMVGLGDFAGQGNQLSSFCAREPCWFMTSLTVILPSVHWIRDYQHPGSGNQVLSQD